MTTVLSIVLVATVGLFIVWPFIRPSTEVVADADADDPTPLERQKRDAYGALREIELDWRMGKLSDTDYATQREQYRRQALAAIAAIEETRARPKRERKIGAPVRSPRRIAFCPACGGHVPPRGNFCGRCGHSLRELVA